MRKQRNRLRSQTNGNFNALGSKTGKLSLDYLLEIHDDRFWALALAVYAADQVHPASRPIARVI